MQWTSWNNVVNQSSLSVQTDCERYASIRSDEQSKIKRRICPRHPEDDQSSSYPLHVCHVSWLNCHILNKMQKLGGPSRSVNKSICHAPTLNWPSRALQDRIFHQRVFQICQFCNEFAACVITTTNATTCWGFEIFGYRCNSNWKQIWRHIRSSAGSSRKFEFKQGVSAQLLLKVHEADNDYV